MGLQGNIEVFSRQGVLGWVREEDEPDTPVSVVVTVDDQPRSRVLANAYRMDLEQAGIGTGRHGFTVRLEGLSPLEPHTVGLIREADGLALPGSPVIIPPTARFDTEVRDYLAAMLPDAGDDDELLRRAAFLAQQADRLLQLRADRRAGRADRFAPRQFGVRWSGRGDAPAPGPAPRALVIDDRMPAPERDAGSQAIVSHMHSLQRLGFGVVFAPADTRGGAAEAMLGRAGIALSHAPWTGSVEELLRREQGGFSLVYVHRASNTRYFPLIRHHQPRARLIYSVADLHHVRFKRQAEVEQRPELIDISKRVRIAELSAASAADAVITHSSFEAALLKQDLPNARIHLLRWAVAPRPVPAPFAERRGMAFIGSFGHPPNLDAAWWLIQDVMPAVRALNPALTCRLVGSDMPDSLRAAEAPGLQMVGPVADLAGLFGTIRLTVAPLTFGAGVKGKVLDSLAAGIPCACTAVAAEGLDLPEALRATIADTPPELAQVIQRLHEDEAFNLACARAGLAYVAQGLSETRLDALMREVVQLRSG